LDDLDSLTHQVQVQVEVFYIVKISIAANGMLGLLRAAWMLYRCPLHLKEKSYKTIFHLPSLNIAAASEIHSSKKMGPYKPRTGHTGRILYTWPYYRPSKGPSNCPKC